MTAIATQECAEPSVKGYDRHLRRKEPTCDGCKAAVRDYRQLLKERTGQVAPGVRSAAALERDVLAQVDAQPPPEPPPAAVPAGDRVLVDARALRDALLPYGKIIRRGAYHVPVLGCVRLATTADTLVIQGTNLEATLETRVATEPGPAELTVAVAYETLMRAARAAVPKSRKDAATVALRLGDGTLDVSSGARRQHLHLAAVEDFPTVAKAPAAGRELDGAAFARAVAQVSPAVCDDQARPVLNAALLRLGSERVTIAATDSYRLAVRNVPYTTRGRARDDADVLVQHAAFALAGKLFATSPTVTLSWDAFGLAVSDDTRTLLTRPVEGEFPKYRALIPDLGGSDYGALEVDRQQLIDTLAGFPRSVQANSLPVTLTLAEDELVVSATQQDVGTATVTLAARWNGAVGLTIGFNPGFLRDGLAGFPGPVTVWARDALKPVLLVSADAEQGDVYLLMPVRLS